ncbi:RING/U-box superfamily protein, putative [Theobroma cacao]|uniref:RING/U-box superfamily protein, putative n=1 Tax=Theobroma cacao TaxID=3641 RepID=A0A061FZX5_THECC|nr:RING/U-box superfamily protein, putative [Theobroma cacao]
MWRGRSGNSDSYWDNIEKNLYDMFFYEADNIQQIYHDEGLAVPIYQRHDNNYSDGDNYGSSSSWGEYSGHTSDEALARHLQEMEDGFQNFSFDEHFRTVSAGAGGVSQEGPSFSGGDQDNVDPDNMTYEQISELGQSIGSAKKGLSVEQMSRLPTHKYKGSSKKKGKSGDEDSESLSAKYRISFSDIIMLYVTSEPRCVICKMQYRRGNALMTLPCAHKYHEECIKNWLGEDNSCCVCKEEVAV